MLTILVLVAAAVALALVVIVIYNGLVGQIGRASCRERVSVVV